MEDDRYDRLEELDEFLGRSKGLGLADVQARGVFGGLTFRRLAVYGEKDSPFCGNGLYELLPAGEGRVACRS